MGGSSKFNTSNLTQAGSIRTSVRTSVRTSTDDRADILTDDCKEFRMDDRTNGILFRVVEGEGFNEVNKRSLFIIRRRAPGTARPENTLESAGGANSHQPKAPLTHACPVAFPAVTAVLCPVGPGEGQSRQVKFWECTLSVKLCCRCQSGSS